MTVAPSQRNHSIHGAFGSPSFASVIPSVSSAQATSFASLPNISYSRGANLSILSARTSSPSIPTSSSSVTSLFTPRTRRFSVTAPASARRAPPPPPIVSRTPAEDPFVDATDSEPIIIALPPPRRSARAIASRTPLFSAYTVSSDSRSAPSSPPGIQQSPTVAAERRAAKLVANVLLNRGCGRPMRRRMLSYGEGRPYVKSCLSRVVEVEC